MASSSTVRVYKVGPEETIADVLERNGHDTYRSCGRELSEVPDPRDDSQLDSEHASNTRINGTSPAPELDV